MRHPPHVDGPAKAKNANMNRRGVRPAGVMAPVPAVAEDGGPADVDANAFWHVDIDVAERRQDGYRRPSLIDRGFTQIKVQVSENTGNERPPGQPKPAAPHDMTKQGRAEPGGPAGTGLTGADLGQVLPDLRQVPAEPRPKGGLDTLGELLQGQPARHKVLAQRRDSILPVSI